MLVSVCPGDSPSVRCVQRYREPSASRQQDDGTILRLKKLGIIIPDITPKKAAESILDYVTRATKSKQSAGLTTKERVARIQSHLEILGKAVWNIRSKNRTGRALYLLAKSQQQINAAWSGKYPFAV